MKRILIFSIFTAISITTPTLALEVLEPDFTVETYATYSEPGIGTPRSMTFDDDDNLYITQSADGSVWRITSEGAGSEFVSGLQSPRGIVWAGGTSYGNYLYVVEYGTWSGGVCKIGLDGTTSDFASMISGGHAPSPIGLDRTGDYSGHLYVGTTGQDHTYEVDTVGNVTKFSDFPGHYDGGGPADIAFGLAASYGGLMYMSTSFVGVNQLRSGLFALDVNGNATRFTDDLVTASRIDFDLDGYFDKDMFVSGKSGFGEPWQIWRVGPDGTATEFARTTVSDPYGLAFGPDGAMYVAEYDDANNTVIITRIQKAYVEPSCYPGNALEFDGMNDYVVTNFLDPSDKVTASAWVKVFGRKGEQTIVGNFHNRGYGLLYDYAASDKFSLAVYINDAYRFVFSNTTIELDRWYHVAATYDGDNGYLYIDGVKQTDSFGIDGTIRDPVFTITIGANPEPGGIFNKYFKGDIDNIHIFNRALSAEEIQQLHCYGLVEDSNLMCYYNFDEGRGQVLYDMSGNGHDGRLGTSSGSDLSDPLWVVSDATRNLFYVDDDGPDDPAPGIPGPSVGEPGLSDPLEDGSCDHPFDSIQKAVNNAVNNIKGCHPTVVVLDGTYTGIGNYDIDPYGLAVTIKSENGPSDCIIDCNSLGRAFILQSGEDNNTIIDGFIIKNGYSTKNGGAIFCDGSGPVIKNCIIKDNYAKWSGSAIWLQYASNALISGCTITNNDCKVAGAITSYASRPTIENCLLTGNRGHWSGAMTSTKPESNPRIINCTIADNFAARGPGGLECFQAGNLTVINSILWNNTGEQIFEEEGTASVTYSDLQILDSNGLIEDSNWPGQGNINADPLFVAPQLDDYHLKSTAGRWTYILETNGDFNNDGIIDFFDLKIFTRYWLQSSLADLNADKTVDFADYAILAAAWLGTDLEADINSDGLVDRLDLEILARYWLQASLTVGKIVDLNDDEVVDFADYALLAANWLKPGHNVAGWTYTDTETSPCIDAGDPGCDYTLEPEPNGGRINMGTYGNTPQASKSPE